jgi:MATE family multidrug resistance protein
LLYFALRRYLQAVNVVRPVMLTLVTANLINAAVNWLLVFGHAGFPALGVEGAAWATCISRTYMFVVLALVTRSEVADLTTSSSSSEGGLEVARLRRLVALGWPAAAQLTLEVGVFAAASALAARLEPHFLAAHHIVLNLAGLTFMVPLGVSSAGAVRVGHAVGRGDPAGAQRAGWVALAIGAAFMAIAALMFVSVPHLILRVFTSDVEVVATGVTLLLVAAVFQLFDGLQGVATGVLRGLGDTRTAMLSCLAGHWGIGLPVGYALCFWWGFGVVGLWIGLSTGLILVGIVLVPVWHRRVKALYPKA